MIAKEIYDNLQEDIRYLIKQSNIKSIITTQLSNCFLDKIKEINAIFGQLHIISLGFL